MSSIDERHGDTGSADFADSFHVKPDSRQTIDTDLSGERGNVPAVDDKINVLWDDDKVFCPGVVQPEADDGTMTIHYGNGDVEADVDMTVV